jgi:hypothetical protein
MNGVLLTEWVDRLDAALGFPSQLCFERRRVCFSTLRLTTVRCGTSNAPCQKPRSIPFMPDATRKEVVLSVKKIG